MVSNSHGFNLYHLLALITRSILISHMPALCMRYPREKLLRIRIDTLSLSRPYDWNSKDSVWLPNNRGPQARLDTCTIKEAVHKQRAIPTIIRPRLHNNAKTWTITEQSYNHLSPLPRLLPDQKMSSGSNNLIQVPAVRKKRQSANTPSLLYANYRPLNTWKLVEIQEVHKPNIM